MTFDLSEFGIDVETILRNAAPATLYQEALRYDKGTTMSDTGALIAYSGDKTGRSPKDKRVVKHPDSADDVWWGAVNIGVDESTFSVNRERAIDYLNTRERLYCVDGFAGWDPEYRMKVRVICARPYHALFMHNMLIRPTSQELADFGEPDCVIYNAGGFPGQPLHDRHDVQDERRPESGTKGGRDPGHRVRRRNEEGRLHADELPDAASKASCRCIARPPRIPRPDSRPCLFGLSGTGKTTLSADPKRRADRRRRALLDRRRHLQHRRRLLRQGHLPDTRSRTADLRCAAIRRGAGERRLRRSRSSRRLRRHQHHRKHPRLPIRSSSSPTPRFRASPIIRPMSSF